MKSVLRSCLVVAACLIGSSFVAATSAFAGTTGTLGSKYKATALGAAASTATRIDFYITSKTLAPTATAALRLQACRQELQASNPIATISVLDSNTYDDLRTNQGMSNGEFNAAIPLGSGLNAMTLINGSWQGCTSCTGTSVISMTAGVVSFYAANYVNLPDLPVACQIVTPVCTAQPTYAVDPLTGNCSIFANSCDMPIRWTPTTAAQCTAPAQPIPTYTGINGNLVFPTVQVTDLGGNTSMANQLKMQIIPGTPVSFQLCSIGGASVPGNTCK